MTQLELEQTLIDKYRELSQLMENDRDYLNNTRYHELQKDIFNIEYYIKMTGGKV